MKPLYLTLFLVSAAALAFQVGLTRLFSLAQGHQDKNDHSQAMNNISPWVQECFLLSR